MPEMTYAGWLRWEGTMEYRKQASADTLSSSCLWLHLYVETWIFSISFQQCNGSSSANNVELRICKGIIWIKMPEEQNTISFRWVMLDTFPFSSCCCGGKIPTSMDISELNFAQLAHPLMLFLSKNLMSVSLCCGLQLLALTAKYIFTEEGNQKTNINNSLSQSFPIFQFPQFEKSTFSLFLVNSLLLQVISV